MAEEEETVPLDECSEKRHKNEGVVPLYPERWWVLASMCVIQFASYGHLIAYGTVTKVTAVYYDQPGDKMDLVVLGPYVINFPTLLVLMVTFNGMGLRKTLNLSAFLTAVGESPMSQIMQYTGGFNSTSPMAFHEHDS